MNLKLLMLALLTLLQIYRQALNYATYRSANNPTPANVSDVYDAETYAKWKRYCAEKCRLEMFSGLLGYVVTALLLAFNAHAAVAGLFGGGAWMQMLVVVAFDALVEAVTSAAANYVDTMIIEQKYEFNRSTMKTFVLDQVRSLAISIILSLVLLSALMLIHQWLGDYVVVLFAAVLFGITLLISFLYPIFSRIGNKFEPLPEGELREKLTALLEKYDYKVKAIEVMDASRRTTKSNAYFTGFGKMKTIVLFDNLLNTMTDDEICAVFAHELGHGLHKDVLKQQSMNLGSMLVMSVIIWLMIRTPALHQAFGFDTVNYGFAYVLLGIGTGLVSPLIGMAMNVYSRFAEYRADRQAAAEGYGEALVTGLKKLSHDNFAHLAPSRAQVILEYSHPPLSERIAALDKAKKE